MANLSGMLKLISLVVISLLTTSCSEKREIIDCSGIHNGQFEYYGNGKELITIERNDSIQIERNEKNGLVMKFRLEWNSPCTYKLKEASFVIDGRDSAIDPSLMPSLETEVLSVTKNYYICQTVMDGKKNCIRIPC